MKLPWKAGGGVQCPRGHHLLVWDPATCPAQHEHRMYMCEMRIGPRRCGQVVIEPPYGPGCEYPDR